MRALPTPLAAPRSRTGAVLAAVLAGGACSFFPPALDLDNRPCGPGGACVQGYSCNVDNVCVAAGRGEGEGEGGGGGEGEGEGGAEGEGSGPVVVIDAAAVLTPDGTRAIVLVDGGFDLVDLASGTVENQARDAAFHSLSVRGFRSCENGAAHVVFATTDALFPTDDNGVADIYAFNFGEGTTEHVSQKSDGGFAPSGGGGASGAIDVNVSADCAVVAFASDERIMIPDPPGYTPGQRYFYVERGDVPSPVLLPNGDVAADCCEQGSLNRTGNSFVFPIGEENPANIIRFDVGANVAGALLASIGAATFGRCPMLNDDETALLFQTAAALDPSDNNGVTDIYVATNPNDAGAVAHVVGSLLAIAQPPPSVPVCGGAAFPRGFNVTHVLVATATPLDGSDSDASADVYDVDALSGGAPVLANIDPFACATLPAVVGSAGIFDVAADGRYALGNGLDRTTIGTSGSCP